MAVVLGSCASILSFLQEDDDTLKIVALKKLNEPGVVEMFWTEIADYLAYIEVLHEDESFPDRNLAALVAAKVYYHLDESTDALRLALRAGDLFDLSDSSSPFVRAVVAYAVDTYIAHKRKEALRKAHPELDDAAEAKSTDASDAGDDEMAPGSAVTPLDMTAVSDLIARLHDQSLAANHLTYALGVALESEDVEKVQSILEAAGERRAELLAFALEQAPRVVTSDAFRTAVLAVVARSFLSLAGLDEASLLAGKTTGESLTTEAKTKVLAAVPGLAACFLRLNDMRGIGSLLQLLAHSDCTKLHAAATQVAFDVHLVEQPLLAQAVIDVLKPTPIAAPVAAAAETTTAPAPATDDETAPLISEVAPSDAAPAAAAPAAEGIIAEAEEVSLEESPSSERVSSLVSILRGVEWSRISLQLLAKNNKTDLGIYDELKSAFDGLPSFNPNNSSAVSHNATVISHALAQQGTSNDQFLRLQMDWLKRAKCWAKFTATASMGVVHAGQADGLKLLKQYLPPQGATSEAAQGTQRSSYAEGGAFYGLGLIHASAPLSPGAQNVKAYLLQQLKDNTTCEVRLHGACLGLGLVALGTCDGVVYEALKTVLYTDMATAGEAAALAIGLLMMGSANEQARQDLHAYAHESTHEKIIRACALAIGLVLATHQGTAEADLDALLADQDAAIRYGGILACGLAYAGSSSLVAQRRLLKVSVSDVSEDVRRGAVTALGFVLADRPHKVAESVKLICENYSFQVRYGAAMALGIGCAGTGNKDALTLLHKMSDDASDVVKQAALLGVGMVVMNTPDAGPAAVSTTARALLMQQGKVHSANASSVSRLGGLIGLGLANAAGRNGTTGFVITAPATSNVSSVGSAASAEDLTEAPTGQVRLRALAGQFLMSQLWYWYPIALCGSLSVRPSLLVGVTADAKVPLDFSVRSAASKEKLAYPEPVKKEVKAKPEKVAAAILSVTQKKTDTTATPANANAEEKKKEEDTPAGDVQMDGSTPAAAPAAAAATTGDAAATSTVVVSPSLTAIGAPARKYETLPNGSRVMPQIAESIIFVTGSAVRFQPLYAPNPSTQMSIAGTTAPIRRSGPVVLVDTKPTAGEFERIDVTPAVVEEKKATDTTTPAAAATGGDATAANANAAAGDDATPSVPIPEDFEWDGN